MQRMTIEKYLEDRVEDQYSYYSSAASRAKKKYQTLKLIEICLLAISPFLNGFLNEKNADILKIPLGLITMVVLAISGALFLFKFHENWVTYRVTAEALKVEKYLFLTRSGPYKNKGATQGFIEKIETILGEENQKWQTYILEKEDKPENEETTLSTTVTSSTTLSKTAPELNSEPNAEKALDDPTDTLEESVVLPEDK